MAESWAQRPTMVQLAEVSALGSAGRSPRTALNTPATKIRTNPYSGFGPATSNRGSRGIRDQPRNLPTYTEKRIVWGELGSWVAAYQSRAASRWHRSIRTFPLRGPETEKGAKQSQIGIDANIGIAGS